MAAGGSSELNLKAKGDFAELMVAADLRRRGFRIAIPFGEDCDFDLILIGPSWLERVQVKYAKSDGAVIRIKCFSHSLTNGKIRQTKHYTAESIDLLAVYDGTSSRCYYVPAAELGSGRSVLHLRLRPATTADRDQEGRGLSGAATGGYGASRNRTGDLLNANQALCHLSYGPAPQIVSGFA